jgi:hypothetical protein
VWYAFSSSKEKNGMRWWIWGGRGSAVGSSFRVLLGFFFFAKDRSMSWQRSVAVCSRCLSWYVQPEITLAQPYNLRYTRSQIFEKIHSDLRWEVLWRDSKSANLRRLKLNKLHCNRRLGQVAYCPFDLYKRQICLLF